MRQGKVSEVVLKRSVFKNISSKNKKILSGAYVSSDAGVIETNGSNMAVATSGIVDYTEEYKEYMTFYKTYNSVIAKGAKPVALILNVIMAEKTKEKELKEVTKKYDELCRKHGMQICSGHTQYSNKVSEMITTVTIVGKMCDCYEDIAENKEETRKLISEGKLKIVMTKSLGIEGTAIISKDREDVLRKRFNGRFCDECIEFKDYISIEKEADIAMKNKAMFMHDISGGGVFAAIWEVASVFGTGAEIDLRSIPVLQETIEVTELFDINPYKMASQGSLLIITDNEKQMIDALEENGIGAAVIGKLTEGNDKVLINNDEKRFLEPPRGDEIYKAGRS